MVRESIHTKIEELLELLSINNTRLRLHSEGLSMLDIDVLRKQCIELYEQINKLALQPRAATKASIPAVQESRKVETEIVIEQRMPETIIAPVPESLPAKEPEVVVPEAKVLPKAEEPIPHTIVEQKEEIVPPNIEIETQQEPAKSVAPKVAKNKDKVKSHRHEDEEMKSLFEKFSNKPIESIAKSMSLAKRFEFQTSFFGGEAKEYNTFMSLLDDANDREEAFAIYHAYKAKFKWENEELKDELKALMYRKHS